MDERQSAQRLEVELLARAKQGDLDAFEQLVIRHERQVFRLALRMTGGVEDAKDVTQETFLLFHRKMGQIQSDRSLGPWLYSVAVNVCRGMSRNRRRSRLVVLDRLADSTPDGAPDPERLLNVKQREECLRSALETLPLKERAALLMREMEGMTTKEVARTLGSCEATVRVQIGSARLKLREFFAKRFGEHS